MLIKEYSNLIKTEFPYLFRKYGFKIVHAEEYRPGYGWFRIGLESKMCRILFAREQGGGIMFCGPLGAPFDNEDNEQWVVMLNLLTYLLKKKWDWRFLGSVPQGQRIKVWLSFNAKALEPLCGQVLGMFRSADFMAEWMPAYRAYLAKKALEEKP